MESFVTMSRNLDILMRAMGISPCRLCWLQLARIQKGFLWDMEQLAGWQLELTGTVPQVKGLKNQYLCFSLRVCPTVSLSSLFSSLSPSPLPSPHSGHTVSLSTESTFLGERTARHHPLLRGGSQRRVSCLGLGQGNKTVLPAKKCSLPTDRERGASTPLVSEKKHRGLYARTGAVKVCITSERLCTQRGPVKWETEQLHLPLCPCEMNARTSCLSPGRLDAPELLLGCVTVLLLQLTPQRTSGGELLKGFQQKREIIRAGL